MPERSAQAELLDVDFARCDCPGDSGEAECLFTKRASRVLTSSVGSELREKVGIKPVQFGTSLALLRLRRESECIASG
jgi:hypothetical protein